MLRAAARRTLPSLAANVLGTALIYSVARPHFADASLWPLLLASLVPVAGSLIGLIRDRRLDVFALMVLLGIAVSVAGALLGGGERALLMRESAVTGLIGLVLLLSLPTRRPLGVVFARQLLTGNDRRQEAEFGAFLEVPRFRRAMWQGTLLWGGLLFGECLLRVLLVLTLPVLVVLVVAPLAFNVLLVAGIGMSAVWGGRLLADPRRMTAREVPAPGAAREPGARPCSTTR